MENYVYISDRYCGGFDYLYCRQQTGTVKTKGSIWFCIIYCYSWLL